MEACPAWKLENASEESGHKLGFECLVVEEWSWEPHMPAGQFWGLCWEGGSLTKLRPQRAALTPTSSHQEHPNEKRQTRMLATCPQNDPMAIHAIFNIGLLCED
eukprot:1940094-Amphidinium_carterae.1